MAIFEQSQRLQRLPQVGRLIRSLGGVSGLVLSRAAGPVGPTTITLIDHVGAGSTSGNTFTTPAMNLAGGNFVVFQLSYLDFGGGAPTITDSLGNSDYIMLTPQSAAGGVRGAIFYRANTTGASVAITATGIGFYGTICAATFSNVKTAVPFDQENGNAGTATDNIDTGLVTPTEDNELIVTGVNRNVSIDAVSIDSGFAITDQVASDGANRTAGALAFKIQIALGSEQPIWSWGTLSGVVTEIATFKKA